MDKTVAEMLTTEALAAHAADEAYLEAHFDEWLEQYPDQWVVVKDGELLLVSPNEADVVAIAKQHKGSVAVDLMQPYGPVVHAVTER